MNTPTTNTGALLLNIAAADVNLSTNEPILFAENAPKYNPIKVIIIVEVENNKIVLGNFSNIILLTCCDPESLVRKRALPRSNVIVLRNFVPIDLGEYHDSSKPSA